MKIWVDADACPRPAKEIIYRTSNRLGVPTVLVANTPLTLPTSDFISSEVVEGGMDVADDFIVDHCNEMDVVISADIPLADRVITVGAIVIDPRGQMLDAENIKPKLATRNLMSELRDQGMLGGGPAPYTARDKSKFASSLDATLTRLLKGI